MSAKSIAVALGGGGARGLAHIIAVEAFDELGIRPAAIAGTSIGAAIGAAWAAGMTGKQMRTMALAQLRDQADVLRKLMSVRVGKWSDLFSGGLGNPMLLDAEAFAQAFLPAELPERFEDLPVSLTAVASDLATAQARAIASGGLRRGIAASLAVPGLFRPVMLEGHPHVDGAATDPVPFEMLRDAADFVLAIDVGKGTESIDKLDQPFENLFMTISVMGQALIAEKLRRAGPDVLLRPNVSAFRLLDFYRVGAILRAAEPMRAEIRQALSAQLA